MITALLRRLGILGPALPPRPLPPPVANDLGPALAAAARHCELCHRTAKLKLTPYRDSCRWVCGECYRALNDDGNGP